MSLIFDCFWGEQFCRKVLEKYYEFSLVARFHAQMSILYAVAEDKLRYHRDPQSCPVLHSKAGADLSESK